MTIRKLTIEHNGKTYGGQIGTIKSTTLGYEGHGILTAYLAIEWTGGGISAGGLCLDEPKDRESRDYSRKGTAYGLDHIIRVLETVGVDAWEKLSGREVIVLFEGVSAWGSRSVGIASTTDENRVLIFSEHADAWRDAS